MNNTQSTTPVVVRRPILKAFEAKLLKNSKVEGNIPFNRYELEEHYKANPGPLKMESGEYQNRKERRSALQVVKPVKTITVPPVVLQSKEQGRKRALELLEAQLIRKTKPAKESGYSAMLNKPYKVGEIIPLKQWEIEHIETTIANLKKKLGIEA